jgi:hypothetical protein
VAGEEYIMESRKRKKVPVIVFRLMIWSFCVVQSTNSSTFRFSEGRFAGH